VSGDERIRLFCAYRLPQEAMDLVVQWQQGHLRGDRIVPRENLHITLAFLGSRPVGELDAIKREFRAATGAAARPVFHVDRYQETPRVGMLRLSEEADSSGVALASDLSARFSELGVPRDFRADLWKGHITVLRFRERPRLDPPIPDVGPFSPSDAAVFISRLRPDGAQYEVLEIAGLGG
jgi:2'-5' RNA ligase